MLLLTRPASQVYFGGSQKKNRALHTHTRTLRRLVYIYGHGGEKRKKWFGGTTCILHRTEAARFVFRELGLAYGVREAGLRRISTDNSGTQALCLCRGLRCYIVCNVVGGCRSML